MKNKCLVLFLFYVFFLCFSNTYAQEAAHQPDVFEEIRRENSEGKQSDNFYYEFFNMLATLGLLVAFLLAASWLVKRMTNTRIQQMNASSDIKVIERRNISPKAIVYLIEVRGKQILLAESHAGITLLSHAIDATAVQEEEQN